MNHAISEGEEVSSKGSSLNVIDDTTKLSSVFTGHIFGLDLILQFLNLLEIRKILIMFNRSRPKFVPTPTLLREILKKALLSCSRGILVEQPHSQARVIMPTLLLTNEEKTLTLQTMRRLYGFIRNSITSECQLCSLITVKDKVCTFTNNAGEDRELSFKVLLASSQCSDTDCNQIVLWDCCVCKKPCSECLLQVTTCDTCEGKACTDCFQTDGACKNCHFNCDQCAGIFPLNEKVFCEACSNPEGPFCLDCAPQDSNEYDIYYCNKCYQMACVCCVGIITCGICDLRFCNDCNTIYECIKCCSFTCFECKPVNLYKEQVTETLCLEDKCHPGERYHDTCNPRQGHEEYRQKWNKQNKLLGL
jgi:hypothetical protein